MQIHPIKVSDAISFESHVKQTKNTVHQELNNNLNNLPAIQIINPDIIESEYLTELDLKNLNVTQKQWADDFSKRYNIPAENIKKMLPKVKIGDTKSMILSSQFGYYDPNLNDIKINPVKECVNTVGGADGIVVHESLHGYLANLRDAFIKNESGVDIEEKTFNVILDSIKQGECYDVLGQIAKDNKTGDFKPKFIYPPLLSTRERKELCKFIDDMGLESLDSSFEKLSLKGLNNVKNKLMPKLKDLPKQYEGIYKNPQFEMFKDVSEYISSCFVRFNVLGATLLKNLPNISDEKRILSQNEKKLAEESFVKALDTLMGNMAIREKSSTSNATKLYFSSFEENFARKETAKIEMNKINQKLDTIKAQGLVPTKALLDKKLTLENDMKILHLTNTINELETEMASLPQSLTKLRRFHRLKNNINQVLNNPELPAVLNISKKLRPILAETPMADRILTIKNAMSDEQFNLFRNYIQTVHRSVPILEKMKHPKYFMEVNNLSTSLLTEYKQCMKKMHELVLNTSLVPIPREFFANLGDYLANMEKHAINPEKILSKLHI